MTTSNDDFWGESADWPDAPQGERREPRATAGQAVSRWWNKTFAGGTTGNRQHGRSRSNAPLPADLEDEPLSIRHSGEHPVVHRAPADEPTPARRPDRSAEGSAPGADHPTVDDASARRRGTKDGAGDVWDDDWQVEPKPGPRPGVDPLLARLGGAAIVMTLFVPLLLGLGSGDDEPAAGTETQQPAITLTAPGDVAGTVAPSADTVAAPPALQPATQATPSAISNTTISSNDVTVTAAPSTAGSTPSVAADAPTESSPELATGALASGTAERVEPNCAIDYTVVAGDFWIRLAEASGVSIDELLDANAATSDTPLYPGSTICLPGGASNPSPPTTAAPTTAAPAPTTTATTTKPVTTPAPTAAAPTTVKPVVTYPTPSAAAVQQIIRDVWPDELEDRAIAIADRESNFVATARNSCCYGVFQMHWEAHKSWLTGVGITTPEQLFDVTSNAYVAYALYQRSGGWGPWT